MTIPSYKPAEVQKVLWNEDLVNIGTPVRQPTVAIYAFGDKTESRSLARLPRLPLFNKRKNIASAYKDAYWKAGFRAQVPERLKKYLHY